MIAAGLRFAHEQARPQERAKAIQLLCEGMSIRAVTRVTGFSKTTVSKLVVDAAKRPLGIRTAYSKA